MADPSVAPDETAPESSDASAAGPTHSSAEAAATPYRGKLPGGWPQTPEAAAPPQEAAAPLQDAGDRPSPELPYSLVLYGIGFESYEMHLVGAAIVRLPDRIIQDSAWRMVAFGSFFLPFPSVLRKGEVYQVDYFVDREEDGLCQPQHDPAWRIVLPEAVGDVDLMVNASDQTFEGACAAF